MYDALFFSSKISTRICLHFLYFCLVFSLFIVMAFPFPHGHS